MLVLSFLLLSSEAAGLPTRIRAVVLQSPACVRPLGSGWELPPRATDFPTPRLFTGTSLGRARLGREMPGAISLTAAPLTAPSLPSCCFT